MRSPKARARGGVRDAFRSRGRSNTNLWLVFSPKTEKDWLVCGDHHLVHWLTIEGNPLIRSFDLTPEDLTVTSAEYESDTVNLDATVIRENGIIEWHQLSSASSEAQPKIQERCKEFAQKSNAHFVQIDKKSLSASMTVSMRLLGAISYAAAIRDEKCTALTATLSAFIHELRSGTVGQLLETFNLHDEMRTAGVLVRLAARGVITLDLSSKPFGRRSVWSARDPINETEQVRDI